MESIASAKSSAHITQWNTVSNHGLQFGALVPYDVNIVLLRHNHFSVYKDVI